MRAAQGQENDGGAQDATVIGRRGVAPRGAWREVADSLNILVGRAEVGRGTRVRAVPDSNGGVHSDQNAEGRRLAEARGVKTAGSRGLQLVHVDVPDRGREAAVTHVEGRGAEGVSSGPGYGFRVLPTWATAGAGRGAVNGGRGRRRRGSRNPPGGFPPPTTRARSNAGA